MSTLMSVLQVCTCIVCTYMYYNIYRLTKVLPSLYLFVYVSVTKLLFVTQVTIGLLLRTACTWT